MLLETHTYKKASIYYNELVTIATKTQSSESQYRSRCSIGMSVHSVCVTDNGQATPLNSTSSR